MLVKNVTDTRPIPHEPGQSITIRRLSGPQKRQSKEAVGDRAIDKMRRMGGEVVAALDEAADRAAARIRAARNGQPDPAKATDKKRDETPGTLGYKLRNFDIDKVLAFGLVGWSYPEPCDAENKNELDPKTEEWAADQILEFSDAYDDAEAARKKG